jgi:hypothetical protein
VKHKTDILREESDHKNEQKLYQLFIIFIVGEYTTDILRS